MKTRNIQLLVMAAALMLSTSVFGQRGQGRMMNRSESNQNERGFSCNNLNLSEEQEAKISELRIEHLKATKTIKSEISIKHAELKALEIADNPNLKTINAKIDELSSLKTKLQKLNAKHRLEVKSQLTEEQKVLFDAKKNRRKGQRNYAMNKRSGKMQNRMHQNR